MVRYRGDGSAGRKPILLLGHMDVVDARSEDWERDPFTLIEESGYFFGRGTSDNKMGVSMLTTTFLRLKAEGFVPTRDPTDAEFALNSDGGGRSMDESGKPASYLIQASEKTYATFELTTALKNIEAYRFPVMVNDAILLYLKATAAYGTDGKEIRAAGIPTYGVAGLFMKDSDQFAHGLNERVQVRSFFGALDHWKALLTRLAGHPAT